MEAFTFFCQQLGNGLILGSAYALVAIGLTLVFGVLNVINLAQGEIFMVGAFAGLACLEGGLGVTAALIAGGGASAVLGLLIERLALRPLPPSADPHIGMVSTIGAALIIQQLATRFLSARQRPYPTPTLLSERVAIGAVTVDLLNVFILVLAVALTVGLTLVVRHTKVGVAVKPLDVG